MIATPLHPLRLAATVALLVLVTGCFASRSGLDEAASEDTDARVDAPPDATDTVDRDPDDVPTADAPGGGPDVPASDIGASNDVPQDPEFFGEPPDACANLPFINAGESTDDVRVSELTTGPSFVCPLEGVGMGDVFQTGFTAVVPPRSGVTFELVASRDAPQLGITAAYPCDAPDRASCQFYAASSTPEGDVLQQVFVPNSDDSPRFVTVIVYRVGDSGAPSGSFRVQSTRVQIETNLTCNTARDVQFGVTMEAGRGNRDLVCGQSDELTWFRAVLPPMSRAFDSSSLGPTTIYGYTDCACSHGELRNVTPFAQSYWITRPPGPFMIDAAPLDPAASCDNAPRLRPGEERVFRHVDGGDFQAGCPRFGNSENPFFVTVSIPPRSSAFVTARTSTGNADQYVLLGWRYTCDAGCEATVEQLGPQVTLQMQNRSERPVDVIVVASVGFAPMDEETITLSLSIR